MKIRLETYTYLSSKAMEEKGVGNGENFYQTLFRESSEFILNYLRSVPAISGANIDEKHVASFIHTDDDTPIFINIHLIRLIAEITIKLDEGQCELDGLLEKVNSLVQNELQDKLLNPDRVRQEIEASKPIPLPTEPQSATASVRATIMQIVKNVVG